MWKFGTRQDRRAQASFTLRSLGRAVLSVVRGGRPEAARGRTPGMCEALEDRTLMFATFFPADPNGRWASTAVTYSYSNLFSGWASGVSNVDMQNAIEESMGAWASVSPLRFIQRNDSGPAAGDGLYPAASHPQIRVGHHFIDGNPAGGSVLAHAYPPGTDGRNGDFHYDNGNTFSTAFFLETGVHEIGHAIGLDHAGGDIVGGVIPPPTPAIMDALLPGGRYTGLGDAFLLQDDINGIQSLYGNGLGYVIDIFGELNVYGTANNDLVVANVSGGVLTVTMDLVGGGNFRSFSRAINDGTTTVSSIFLHGMRGNDILRVENAGGIRFNLEGGAGDDFFDLGFGHRNLDLIPQETQIFAGAGTDSLFVYDNNKTGNQSFNVSSTNFSRGGWGGARYFDDLEFRNLNTGTGVDTVTVFNTSAGRTTTLNSAGGQDTVNIGSGGFLDGIAGDVVVSNTPSLTFLNLDDSGDNTADIIDVRLVSSTRGRVLGLAGGGIFFDIADIQNINLKTGTGADAVNVVQMTERLFLTNTGGTDTIAIGNSTNGLDQITGAIDILTTGSSTRSNITLEDRAVGNGRSVTFSPNFSFITVTGLPGLLNYSYATVGSFNFRCGGGNDNISIGAILDDGITIFGGAGYNTLTVDDRLNPAAFVASEISPGNLSRTTGFLFGTTLNVSHVDMQAITFYVRSSSTTLNVYGTSAAIDPFNQVSVFLSDNPDTINVYPRDAGGNLTINGNLGIGAAGGSDSVIVHDAGSAVGLNLTFSNPFGAGTQNVFGLGAAGFGVAAAESFTINAGSGDDVFTVDQFLGATGLTLNGNAGADTTHITPNSRLLRNNFSTLANINFNGGADFDTLVTDNSASTDAFTYFRTGSTVVHQFNILTAYVSVSDPLVEAAYLYGGSGAESFLTLSSSVGTSSYLTGNAGADNFEVGSGLFRNLAGVFGPVVVFGDATDTLTVDNSTNTDPHTTHVSNNAIGGFPGDDLFPSGSGVYFFSVGQVRLQLGSGIDTVYVRPNDSIPLIVDGGQPTLAPGDTLTLALADAVNPVVTPTALGAGLVTSDNLALVTYSGFESDPVSDVEGPQIVDVTYGQGIDPFIRLTFDEAVDPFGLMFGGLTVEGYYDAVVLPTSVAYDPLTFAATLTFGNLVDGRLPVGVYSLKVNAASVVDVAGNAFTGTYRFDFLGNHETDFLLIPAGFGTFKMPAFLLTPQQSIDLTDNSLVLDYDGASPVVDVRTRLLAGLGGVSGVYSSTALADVSGIRAIGYQEAADFLMLIDPDTGTWRGQTVDATSLLLQYTYAGDTDLDGDVDGRDLSRTIEGFSVGLTGWERGDVDYDGAVTPADFQRVRATFDALQNPGPLTGAPLNAPPAAGTGNSTAPRLALATQPTDTVVRGYLSPSTLMLQADDGSLAGITGLRVGVRILSGPAGARLSGNAAILTHLGVASFADLTLDKPGKYTLEFSVEGFASVQTKSFVVSAVRQTSRWVTPFSAAPVILGSTGGTPQSGTPLIGTPVGGTLRTRASLTRTPPAGPQPRRTSAAVAETEAALFAPKQAVTVQPAVATSTVASSTVSAGTQAAGSPSGSRLTTPAPTLWLATPATDDGTDTWFTRTAAGPRPTA